MERVRSFSTNRCIRGSFRLCSNKSRQSISRFNQAGSHDETFDVAVVMGQALRH